jgi:hypothetical protein
LFGGTNTSVDGRGYNRWAHNIVGLCPTPLPAQYVIGIDLQQRDFELGQRSYLYGNWQTGGWQSFYFWASIVKVPVGTLGLLCLSVARLLTTRNSLERRRHLVVLVPSLLVMAIAISRQVGFSMHFRYFLPVLAPMFVMASGWAEQTRATGRIPLRSTLGRLLLAWAVVSSMSVYPHSLSYFNEFAGGPLKGTDYLVGSNASWGQDVTYLKQWCEGQPRGSSLYIYSTGFVDPKSIGVSYVAANPVSLGLKVIDPQRVNSTHALAIVDTNLLNGMHCAMPNGSGGMYIGQSEAELQWFEQLSNARPFDRIAYSYKVFVVEKTLRH